MNNLGSHLNSNADLVLSEAITKQTSSKLLHICPFDLLSGINIAEMDVATRELLNKQQDPRAR